MKIFYLIAIAVGISYPMSLFMPSDADSSIINTIYNALSIMFSVGLGLIITISLDGVKNEEYVTLFRKHLHGIRNKFITLFCVCSIIFIGYKFTPDYSLPYLHTIRWGNYFTLSFFGLAMVYFINNFILVQKLKDQIFDRVLKENK